MWEGARVPGYPSRFSFITKRNKTEKKQKAMTVQHYMALADFQDLWTNQIKPEIPTIAGTPTFASVQTSEDIIDELI